jgi:hypothetical protein
MLPPDLSSARFALKNAWISGKHEQRTEQSFMSPIHKSWCRRKRGKDRLQLGNQR